MLKEGYLAKKRSYPEDEIHVVVTATAKSILAPSWELVNDYKAGKITWSEYIKRYVKEMDNVEALMEMIRIRKLAETEDVRLICYEKNYPCHRFILMVLIYTI